MESAWVEFLEVVERLQTVFPGLAKLALRCGQSKDRDVNYGERESRHPPAEERPRGWPFFQHSQKVDLRRCQEFLEELRRQEECLRKTQGENTEELLQVQAARRAFEEGLKEALRAECRSALEMGAPPHATEEEVLAALEEMKEHGGLELDQFIGELEQVLYDRERH